MTALLLLSLLGLAAPALASDAQIIDETGAAQPQGRCAPQIIIRVPDFPEAEHVSASEVHVDLTGSNICVFENEGQTKPPSTVPAHTRYYHGYS